MQDQILYYFLSVHLLLFVLVECCCSLCTTYDSFLLTCWLEHGGGSLPFKSIWAIFWRRQLYHPICKYFSLSSVSPYYKYIKPEKEIHFKHFYLIATVHILTILPKTIMFASSCRLLRYTALSPTTSTFGWGSPPLKMSRGRQPSTPPWWMTIWGEWLYNIVRCKATRVTLSEDTSNRALCKYRPHPHPQRLWCKHKLHPHKMLKWLYHTTHTHTLRHHVPTSCFSGPDFEWMPKMTWKVKWQVTKDNYKRSSKCPLKILPDISITYLKVPKLA